MPAKIRKMPENLGWPPEESGKMPTSATMTT
jgi:hypothetical protein